MAEKKEDKSLEKDVKEEKATKSRKTAKSTSKKVNKTEKSAKKKTTAKKEEKLENPSPFFTYKGKPLVRCKDTIYYGDMKDEYVVRINIEEKKEENGIEKATKLFIQLLSTRTDIDIQKCIIKTSHKENMYLAIDLADAWLSRALAKSEEKK